MATEVVFLTGPGLCFGSMRILELDTSLIARLSLHIVRQAKRATYYAFRVLQNRQLLSNTCAFLCWWTHTSAQFCI